MFPEPLDLGAYETSPQEKAAIERLFSEMSTAIDHAIAHPKESQVPWPKDLPSITESWAQLHQTYIIPQATIRKLDEKIASRLFAPDYSGELHPFILFQLKLKETDFELEAQKAADILLERLNSENFDQSLAALQNISRYSRKKMPPLVLKNYLQEENPARKKILLDFHAALSARSKSNSYEDWIESFPLSHDVSDEVLYASQMKAWVMVREAIEKNQFRSAILNNFLMSLATSDWTQAPRKLHPAIRAEAYEMLVEHLPSSLPAASPSIFFHQNFVRNGPIGALETALVKPALFRAKEKLSVIASLEQRVRNPYLSPKDLERSKELLRRFTETPEGFPILNERDAFVSVLRPEQVSALKVPNFSTCTMPGHCGSLQIVNFAVLGLKPEQFNPVRQDTDNQFVDKMELLIQGKALDGLVLNGFSSAEDFMEKMSQTIQNEKPPTIYRRFLEWLQNDEKLYGIAQGSPQNNITISELRKIGLDDVRTELKNNIDAGRPFHFSFRDVSMQKAAENIPEYSENRQIIRHLVTVIGYIERPKENPPIYFLAVDSNNPGQVIVLGSENPNFSNDKPARFFYYDRTQREYEIETIRLIKNTPSILGARQPFTTNRIRLPQKPAKKCPTNLDRHLQQIFQESSW